MDESPSARDLRNLLSMAIRLRELAALSSASEEDRTLFETAATALEARARGLAGRVAPEPPPAPPAHKPIDLLV